MRNILYGGLTLPFRLFFQPYAFRRDISSLAPDLPQDWSLWRARHHLRDASFRQGLIQYLLQSAVALLYAPIATIVIVLFLQMAGYQVRWEVVAGSVALGVASVLTVTHLFLLPLQWLWSGIAGKRARESPERAAVLWTYHPANWDESILYPLPELVQLLATLMAFDPKRGRAALQKVSAHRYQHGAVPKALALLEQEQIRQRG